MFILRDDTRELDTEFWVEQDDYGGISLKARRGSFSQHLVRIYPGRAELPTLATIAGEKLGIPTQFNKLKINEFEELIEAAKAVVAHYDWAGCKKVGDLRRALNEI